MNEELQLEFEYVRRTGRTNMNDRQRVLEIATAYGFLKLANTALSDKEYYSAKNKFRRPDDRQFVNFCKTRNLPVRN